VVKAYSTAAFADLVEIPIAPPFAAATNSAWSWRALVRATPACVQGIEQIFGLRAVIFK